MDTTEVATVLGALGPRLRSARRALGLSQETVAGADFTKSFISAVERNKVRPSLRALQIIAARLDLSAADLLSEPATPDGSAFDAQWVRYQLGRAAWLIATDQAQMALEQLRKMDAARLITGDLGRRCRFAYLHGLAYLRLEQPEVSMRYLQEAASLADQQPNSSEERTRIANLIGQAYFQQELIERAIGQHEQCRESISAGLVASPSLRLAVYENLARDYRVLGNKARAYSVSRQALETASGGENLRHQAALWQQLSAGFAESGELDLAIQHQERALHIIDAACGLESWASLQIGAAEGRSVRRSSRGAHALLEDAATLLRASGDELGLSIALQCRAALALAQGRITLARRYAGQSLAISAAIYERYASLDPQGQRRALTAYTAALRSVASIAEAQGQHDATDAGFTAALRLLESGSDIAALIDAEFEYAEILRGRGEHQAANDHYHQAYHYRRQRD